MKVFGASDVGFMVEYEEATATCANVSCAGDDCRFTVGRTGTVTNYDHDSGTADVYGTVTNPTVNRGNYNQLEGSFSALVAYGGYLKFLNTGTSASVTGKGNGTAGPVFDCEGNNGPRPWTATTFTGGAYMLDENKSTTLGGGTHTADTTFFANSRLGPTVTWSRT